MEHTITVDEILTMIRNKRNRNEAWMTETLARSQWDEHSGHRQRRDAMSELLADIHDIDLYKKHYPTYTVPELSMEDALNAAHHIAENESAVNFPRIRQ